MIVSLCNRAAVSHVHLFPLPPFFLRSIHHSPPPFNPSPSSETFPSCINENTAGCAGSNIQVIGSEQSSFPQAAVEMRGQVCDKLSKTPWQKYDVTPVPKMPGIYAIGQNVGGKETKYLYIGRSNDVKRRLQEHKTPTPQQDIDKRVAGKFKQHKESELRIKYVPEKKQKSKEGAYIECMTKKNKNRPVLNKRAGDGCTSCARGPKRSTTSKPPKSGTKVRSPSGASSVRSSSGPKVTSSGSNKVRSPSSPKARSSSGTSSVRSSSGPKVRSSGGPKVSGKAPSIRSSGGVKVRSGGRSFGGRRGR